MNDRFMLETERLIMRKLNESDLPELIRIRSDPEVYKYLGGPRRQNPEALEKRLRFYISSYDKYGFGTCAMLWKETGEMIGTSGLQPLENTDEIEIGYGLTKAFWGKGLATEAAHSWLEYGFTAAGLKRIVAIALPENTASWRVMEKLGMSFEKTDRHYGLDCVFYAISKKEFFDKRGQMA